MVDMRSSNEERRESISGGPSLHDIPKYPYGLSINLDAKQLRALGITGSPSVDQVFSFKIKTFVKRVSKEDGEGDDTGYNVELQITEMEKEDKKEDSKSETLYKAES